MDTAVCTIVAKPHLAQARVLARSVQAHHPDLPVFVLLSDEVDGCFDPSVEPFTMVPLADLPLRAPEQLRFRYAQQPLSYACTPSILAHLLDRGFRKVLFLKQETMVMARLEPLLAPLEEAPVVLTPHLTAPPAGADTVAREVNILLSGVYNVGVVGVSNRPVARAFLSWWQNRLSTDCRHDVSAGLHFEQRWADLALSFFDGVRVLRDPACNVGHWALPDRRITVDDVGTVFVDGRPVVVFRFSGFDPDVPDAFTRYNRRLDWQAAGDAHLVFDRFRRALIDAGLDETRQWPYAYGHFDNGVPVPDIARDLYAGLGDSVARFGDPLTTAGHGSYWHWLRDRDAGLGVSRFWQAIYRGRPDLQRAFPDLTGTDATAFLAWARAHGQHEHDVPEALMEDGDR